MAVPGDVITLNGEAWVVTEASYYPVNGQILNAEPIREYIASRRIIGEDYSGLSFKEALDIEIDNYMSRRLNQLA